MQKSLLFTEHFGADSNHSSWRFKANDLAMSSLASLLGGSVLDGVDGICSSEMFLRKIKNAKLRKFSYETESVAEWNNVDFSSLHSFLDELYSISAELGPEYGLMHEGIPLLSLIEMRWVDPFFSNTLIHINTIRKVIDNENPDMVRVIGQSPIVNMAMDLARRKKIRFSQGKGVFALPWGLISKRNSIPPYRSLSHGMLKRSPHRAENGIFAESKRRPRVLFIGWLDRTVDRLAVALPALRQGLDADFYLVAEKRVSLTEDLRRAGVVCSYTDQWMDRKDGAALMRNVERASRKGWDQLKRHARSRLGQSWYGVPIFPYAEPVLKCSCLDGGRLSVYFVEIAKRVVERCQPDLVVCFEDWELPKAVTLICRQKKIPTVAYYVLSNNTYCGLVRRSQEWMAVAGDVIYRGFQEQYAEGHIRMVGDTLVDRAVVSSKEEARHKVCSDLRLSFEKPIVLLISSYASAPVTMRDMEDIFKKTAQAAAAIQGAQVVVKTHPGQPTKDVKEWMRSWGCKGQVVDNYNLFSLCQAADIVSAPITTAVLQAMLAKTPVVSIQRRELLEKFKGMGYDYLENKGVVPISPDEDPSPVFKKLLFDHDFREAQIQRGLRHVQEHMGPIDGNATSRLISFLNEITGGALLSGKPRH